MNSIHSELRIDMEIGHFSEDRTVMISNHGRVTIPAPLRKRYGLKDGDYVIFIEDEGTLKIIPVESIEKLRENSYTAEEMAKSMKESRQEELEREA